MFPKCTHYYNRIIDLATLQHQTSQMSIFLIDLATLWHDALIQPSLELLNQ